MRLTEQFETYGADDWHAAVLKALKNADFETLLSRTRDGDAIDVGLGPVVAQTTRRRR